MEKFCPNINTGLLPIKIHYFLFMTALGSALPFRTVFAKQLGISGTAVGVIFFAIIIIKIILNPLLGFIVDYFKRFRLILSIIMIFVGLSHVAMVFIPPKALIFRDIMNVTRKNFHSNLTYIWTQNNAESYCNPKLVLSIQYLLSQKFTKETFNFACDIQCSKSIDNYTINSFSESQCHTEMKYELKIFVQISDCDMNIKLGKGQLTVFNIEGQNILQFEVNDSLTRKLASLVEPSINCSEENMLKLNFSRNLETLNNKNETKVITEDAFKLLIKNENDDKPEYLDNDNIKYYIQNEYNINFYNQKLCMNLCSQQFDCQTKECSILENGTVNLLERFTDDENEFLSSQFWEFFVLMAVSITTYCAAIFLVDAVCYELLQERKEKFGEQRLWSAIGWGFGSLVGGCLNHLATNKSGKINYAPCFYLVGVISLLDLIPIHYLKVTNMKYSQNICKDVCLLLSKIDFLYNLFIVYIIGVLAGFIWNYQFWFMEEIGSSQMLLGLSQMFDCIFELPFFFFSGWIIMKIGHNNCNSAVFLCFGLQYLCLAVMFDPWWTLPVGLFHGPTFALFYASMTMYAKTEAPEGTEATLQSLLHLCFEGTGYATGSFLGGVGLDKFGSRMSFTYAAAMSFIFLFVNIIAGFYFKKT